MAHNKCYAICENKCKVETLSKETIDYRYQQTDNRLTEIHKNLLSLNNEISKLSSKVNQVNDSFMNFYVTEWFDLGNRLNSLDKQIAELKKVANDFQNFYITEFTEAVYKINQLEQRVEALENAE